jgi:hypothetical protein
MSASDAFDSPRPLTVEEIEDVVSVIPSVQAASKSVAEYNYSQILRATRAQLSEISIRPSKIEHLKARISNRCGRARIHPGEPVGFHAAEAISEPITQATLSSFHASGSASVGLGVSGFSEILNLTVNRKSPIAYIHLKNADISHIDGMMAARAFTAMSIKSLMKTAYMTSHPDDGVDESLPGYYSLFEGFSKLRDPSFEMLESYRTAPFLRIIFDKFRLFESRITTASIAAVISNLGGAWCVFSPTNIGIVDVYADRASSSDEVTKRQERIAAKRPAEGGLAAKTREKARVETARINAEKEENIIGRITPDKMDTLFLQMIVLTRIMSETLVVASEAALDAFSKTIPVGSVISPQAAMLSLFRDVKVVKTHVTDIIRGETSVGGSSSRRRLWINTDVEFSASKYVPREKMERLLTFAISSDCILESTSDYIEVELPDEFLALPGSDIMERIGKLKAVATDDWNGRVDKHNAKDPLLPPPPRPEIVTLSEYVSIRGISPISPPLRWLIVHPAINARMTMTNSVHEIAHVRGIEAAKGWIFGELYDGIIATDSSINPRHIQIITNLMTSGGALLQFTASGNVRQQFGAYSECSFEQALKAFQRSAFMGAQETVGATSTSILVGKKCAFGTGSFEVIPHNPAAKQVAELFPDEETPADITESLAGVNSSSIGRAIRVSPDVAAGSAVDGGAVITEADAATLASGVNLESLSTTVQVETLARAPTVFGRLSFPPAHPPRFWRSGPDFLLSPS